MAAIVIPILEAISNSAALPTAASAPQLVADQLRMGGFASMFAAARGLSPAPPKGSGEVQASDAAVAENAGAVANLKVAIPTSGIPQLKKFMNNGPTAESAVAAAMNMVVPGFIPVAATQIPLPPPPQPSLPQPSPLPPRVLQPSLPPSVTVAAPTQTADVSAGTVLPGLQGSAYNATPPLAPTGGSALSQTGASVVPVTNREGTAGSLTDLSTSGVLISSGTTVQANTQETFLANGPQPPALLSVARAVASGSALPNSISGIQWKGSQDGPASAEPATLAGGTMPSALSTTSQQPTSGRVLPDTASSSLGNGSQSELASAEPALPAEGTPPSTLSATAGEVASAAVLPGLVASSQGNSWRSGLAQSERAVQGDDTPPPAPPATFSQPATLIQPTTLIQPAPLIQPGLGNVSLHAALGNQGSPSVTHGSGLEQEEAIPLANQDTQVAEPAPTQPGPLSLAQANFEAGTEADARLSFAANSTTGQANAVVPNAAVKNNVPTQAGTEDPLSALINGQISPATILNPAVQPEPGRFPLQFAAPKATTAITSSNIRGGGVATRPSAPGTGLPAGSNSDNGSQIASQTPFSVFFSSPGPSTESAASVLPKMILPGTGSALRDSHASITNPSSAGSPASGLPSGTSQSGVAQNLAPANIKDSPGGPASEGVQTAQSSHRDAELTAVSVQASALQTAAAPVPAPPASAAATVPGNGAAAAVTDSLPKPDAPPPAAAAVPASAVPAPAETVAASATAPVQVAQLISRIGQTEMRIGMNTSAFGSVEVRTLVHANDVGLVIGSEKGDLRTLLANDMPAITNTLQQQNLRLNSVDFMQGFAFSNNASGGGDSQQRSFVPLRAGPNPGSSEATLDESVELPLAGEFYSGRSLSILA